MQILEGEDTRAVRKHNQLTRSEVAKKAGVSQPPIACIVSNDADPTIDALYSVVSVLRDFSRSSCGIWSGKRLRLFYQS